MDLMAAHPAGSESRARHFNWTVVHFQFPLECFLIKCGMEVKKFYFYTSGPRNNKSDSISAEFGFGLVILELMKFFVGSW